MDAFVIFKALIGLSYLTGEMAGFTSTKGYLVSELVISMRLLLTSGGITTGVTLSTGQKPLFRYLSAF